MLLREKLLVIDTKDLQDNSIILFLNISHVFPLGNFDHIGVLLYKL